MFISRADVAGDVVQTKSALPRDGVWTPRGVVRVCICVCMCTSARVCACMSVKREISIFFKITLSPS